MQDLKADTDILIVRADKGNANVVMNRSEYEKQLEEMLMDRNKAEAEADYWRLRPFDSIAASFYGVPKVHKVSLVEK